MIDFVSNNETLTKKKFMTIAIVSFERIELLQGMMRTLRQALAASPDLDVQIRVGINGPDQATKDFLLEVQSLKIFSDLKIISSKQRLTPAEARNRICFDVSSKWILFLDDDVELPVDFFNHFLNLSMQRPEVTVWGGPNITPKASSLIEKKIGWLLQNLFIVGPIAYRYKLAKFRTYLAEEFFLSLCNLFIKTESFQKILFNPDLKTAEENELIYRILEQKRILMSSPSLYVWHHRRKTFKQFLRQIRNYGFGRGQLLYGYKTKNKILLSTIFILSFFLIAFFPVQILQIMGIWMLGITLCYFFHFKERSLTFLWLPLGIWINYFFGVVSGYWFSYRQTKRTYLYSRT